MYAIEVKEIKGHANSPEDVIEHDKDQHTPADDIPLEGTGEMTDVSRRNTNPPISSQSLAEARNLLTNTFMKRLSTGISCEFYRVDQPCLYPISTCITLISLPPFQLTYEVINAQKGWAESVEKLTSRLDQLSGSKSTPLKDDSGSSADSHMNARLDRIEKQLESVLSILPKSDQHSLVHSVRGIYL